MRKIFTFIKYHFHIMVYELGSSFSKDTQRLKHPRPRENFPYVLNTLGLRVYSFFLVHLMRSHLDMCRLPMVGVTGNITSVLSKG